MRVLAQIAETILWFALWLTIPAALLYPVALWMLNHTQYSESNLIWGYITGIAVLFWPTGFVVDFLYRKFMLKKWPSN
jgi:hypothetical protein